jgi:hypothetical protein
MERIYLFFIRNDVWIYIVCALGLFWYITEFIRTQARLRRAMFSLERETALRVRNNALSFILFLGGLAGFVYYVNARIAPDLPAELFMPPTPTPNLFATPLPSPSPMGGPAEETGPGIAPVLAPTVTLPPELGGPVPPTTDPAAVPGEVTPEAFGTPFAECTDRLMIAEPFNGAAVLPSIVFRGTADTGESHSFIVELNGPQTSGGWAPIAQQSSPQPVINGDLGAADLSQWASGPYLVRLRAMDRAGSDVGYCVIQITLDNG